MYMRMQCNDVRSLGLTVRDAHVKNTLQDSLGVYAEGS